MLMHVTALSLWQCAHTILGIALYNIAIYNIALYGIALYGSQAAALCLPLLSISTPSSCVKRLLSDICVLNFFAM